jgi:hypothetical protein
MPDSEGNQPDVIPRVGVAKRRGGAQDDKGEGVVIPHGGGVERRGAV